MRNRIRCDVILPRHGLLIELAGETGRVGLALPSFVGRTAAQIMSRTFFAYETSR